MKDIDINHNIKLYNKSTNEFKEIKLEDYVYY